MFTVRLLNNELVLVTPPKYELLTEFFEMDIQESVEICDYYINIINQIKNNEINNIDSVGNAFNLFIDKKVVNIENEYTNKKLENLDLNIFINCLEIWKMAVAEKKIIKTS